MKDNNDDENLNFTSVFENDLQNAMRKFGLILPQTIEEVLQVENDLESNQIDFPNSLIDPYALLNQTECKHKFTGFIDDKNMVMEDNLAQAAREGNDISDEVRERMRKDREQADENSNE